MLNIRLSKRERKPRSPNYSTVLVEHEFKIVTIIILKSG